MSYKNGLTFEICFNFIHTVEVFLVKLKVTVAFLNCLLFSTANLAEYHIPVHADVHELDV